MILRPYQKELYQKVRESFRRNRSVFMQLHCGGGKTAIFSHMAASAKERGRRVWICLPRKELLDQASKTLSALGVPHGRIDAKTQESAAFSLHLVSSNTLIRRWDKIKKPPDFIIIDEGHLYFDRQVEIFDRYPGSKILAVSASPERLDGRGLGDLYGDLVEGPSMAWMVEDGYLVPFRYFAPPINGLDKVKRRGYEYDETDLAALLEARKVYGDAVSKYKQHADGKPALVFARSIKEAEKVAYKFETAGYNFLPISSETKGAERTRLIEALRDREIDGLVNCEVAVYGLDVPSIECLIMLRPTTSRALYTQMIGRGSRTSAGKTECTVIDHVGLYQEFGHPLTPHGWNFTGTKKRKRAPDPNASLRLCPETFMYCTKPACTDCGNNKTGRKSRAEEIVDCELREVPAPVELKNRAPEIRREFQDRLDAAIAAGREAYLENPKKIRPGPIGDMIRIGRQLGMNPMWVYWKLAAESKVVQVSLLHEIARQCDYKPGWAWWQKKDIETRLNRKR